MTTLPDHVELALDESPPFQSEESLTDHRRSLTEGIRDLTANADSKIRSQLASLAGDVLHDACTTAPGARRDRPLSAAVMYRHTRSSSGYGLPRELSPLTLGNPQKRRIPVFASTNACQ